MTHVRESISLASVLVCASYAVVDDTRVHPGGEPLATGRKYRHAKAIYVRY